MDFDKIINRENTHSVNYQGWPDRLLVSKKGQQLKSQIDLKKYIRMWVADMDLATPEFILDAIKDRLSGEILGYSEPDDRYLEILSSWFWEHYKWRIDTDELVFSPGVVFALYRLVALTVKEGEGILFNTPSYGPFYQAARVNRMNAYFSPLLKENGKFHLDFKDIKEQLDDPHKRIKMFIFCNPHNPTGRVWTESELREIGEICIKRNIWLISDEIHCDLLREGKTFIPLARLFKGERRIITCTSPSKTFNIAGMQLSHIFITDPELRERWNELYKDGLAPLSIVAAQAAYQSGEEWLKKLNRYLDGSFQELQKLLKELLPDAQFHIPDASYVAWIDLNAYSHKVGEEYHSLAEFLAINAKVVVNGQEAFVANAQGYIRLNIACPRSVMIEGVRRIAKALNG